MAIFTPHGLKIRIPLDYAFALMARLYPDVGPLKVLKTVERFELIPSIVSLITGFVCFYFRFSPLDIFMFVSVATYTSYFLTSFGKYILPLLDFIGMLYIYIWFAGFIFVPLILFGFFTVGWLGIISFILSRSIVSMLRLFEEKGSAEDSFQKTGIWLFHPEKEFFNAYRMYANKLGKADNIVLQEEELKNDNWITVFEDLATTSPYENREIYN